MQLRLSGIRIPVSSRQNPKQVVCEQYHIRPQDVQECRIVRQAIDARKKNKVLYDYQLEVTLPEKYGSLRHIRCARVPSQT